MKIQVLLSTYNGERYLREQLDSILSQEIPIPWELSVLVRDDGSSDATRSLLRRYTEIYPEISYFMGKNIGVIESFFRLVKNADLTADYFAFADQDDVWHPQKLKRAVGVLRKAKLEQENLPILYCGKPRLVDEKLKPLDVSIKQGMKRPAFGNALVENIAFGCTMVVNRELLMLVKEHLPKYTIMHDWWFYLSATAFGKVYYDKKPMMDYRQHSQNEVGAKSSYLDEFAERLGRFQKNRGRISRQIMEFIRLYGEDLSKEKRELAEKLLEGKKNKRVRKSLFWDKRIFRQRPLDDWIFRMIYLTGSY